MNTKSLLVIILTVALVLTTSCQIDDLSGPEVDPLNAGTAGSTSIPAGIGILSGTLTLYVDFIQAEDPPVVVFVHRITDPWDELTVTWDDFGSAYDPNPVASFEVSEPGLHQVDITDLVQGWVDEEYENYGLLLRQDENWAQSYFSSDHTDLSLRPSLEICYSDDCVTAKRDGTAEVADADIWNLHANDNYGDLYILHTGFIFQEERQTLIHFFLSFDEGDEYTRTVGYWKNHAGIGNGNQDDTVSPLLPVWLGNQSGSASIIVDSNIIAVSLLKKKDYGGSRNGIAKLYAQLLATKLNIANGTDDTDVAPDILIADDFLELNDWPVWDDLSKSDRQLVLNWMEIFDAYNNGLIGPGYID